MVGYSGLVLRLVSGHFFALSHFMQLRATLHNLNKKMIVGMIAIILQAFQ